ncbi:MAG: CoA transferase [Betaproteobacteria bacterium]|nr:CoA transferase [Betaproteobacteria bacterium]
MTSMSEPGSGALEGLRILEVAGLCSAYAGRLFAGMGADVILVEPPAGAAHRRQGPFIDNVPSIERSLTFTYLHAGKRSVTLDLDTADGQALFRKLAATASVVVESEPVGVMRARGLDYASLKEINPALVYTSITPFGSDGPYKEYVANDLILLAMGGLLTLGGYAEAEPTRAPGDQALLAGGQFGAIGTMMAVLDAEESGAGQFVDVSVQECVTTGAEAVVWKTLRVPASIRARTARSSSAPGRQVPDGWSLWNGWRAKG